MPRQEFDLSVPPEVEAGVYANFLGVWNTYHEFSLDFGVTMPPEPAEDERGEFTRIPGKVVARVKVPVSVLFDIIRAVNASLDQYEQVFGPVRRPDEGPLYPPDEPEVP